MKWNLGFFNYWRWGCFDTNCNFDIDKWGNKKSNIIIKRQYDKESVNVNKFENDKLTGLWVAKHNGENKMKITSENKKGQCK